MQCRDGSGAVMSGGLLNLFRIALIALNTVGWPISFASSFCFPGKFMSEMPTKIVRTPCPGKNSMAKPARRKTAPTAFFTTSPITRKTG